MIFNFSVKWFFLLFLMLWMHCFEATPNLSRIDAVLQPSQFSCSRLLTSTLERGRRRRKKNSRLTNRFTLIYNFRLEPTNIVMKYRWKRQAFNFDCVPVRKAISWLHKRLRSCLVCDLIGLGREKKIGRFLCIVWYPWRTISFFGAQHFDKIKCYENHMDSGRVHTMPHRETCSLNI